MLCCIGESDPLQAIAKLKELGVKATQLCPWTPEQLTSEYAAKVKAALADAGVTPTTQFIGFPEESYVDIAAVERTVGFLWEEKLAERIETAKKTIDFAVAVGAPHAAAHIGFVPRDKASPKYQRLLETIRELVDYCAARGLTFVFETGQETAEEMREFIEAIDRPNVGVNFDPANMILYGKDKPIEAVDVLAPWIVSCHCKDGEWPTEEGKLGHETPLGEGQVNIPAFIAKLKSIGYKGVLCVEREGGPDRVGDFLKARALLEKCKAE